jgi:hypothetical protein
MRISIVVLAVLVFAPGLAAQHRQLSPFAAPSHEDVPLRESHAVDVRGQPPTSGRIAGFAVVGGMAGAAALGAAGAMLGQTLEQPGNFISESAVLAVAGVAVGYPIGAGLGAWHSGRGSAAPRLPKGRFVLASALGTLAGGILWNRIGETFQPSEPGYHNLTSWYIGAAAGFATHLGITTLVASHEYRKGAAAESTSRSPLVAEGCPGGSVNCLAMPYSSSQETADDVR